MPAGYTKNNKVYQYEAIGELKIHERSYPLAYHSIIRVHTEAFC